MLFCERSQGWERKIQRRTEGPQESVVCINKEITSPLMSDLRNVAHKCTQSRLLDRFQVCLNIAGIDPFFSSEKTVLLEVFI